MHEMAIAGSVLDSVLRHAGGRTVTHVQLKVGRLRQVVPSSLAFSWELIARDTPASAAALVIDEVGVEATCSGCGVESGQEGFPFRCPACGGLDLDVIRGNELLIDWLEVEGQHPA